MSNKKPNILFIMADQWRRQAVGFMEEDPVETPNINQFAGNSLVLENAISCYPLCSPYRASLLTGKYPLSHGVTGNCKPGKSTSLRPDEVSLGNVLKKAGYHTGYIGKWHLDEPDINKAEEPISGAKKWDAYTPPGPKRQGFDFWYAYNTFNDHLNPHYWKNTPEKIEIEEWSVSHETKKAQEYIKSRDVEEPFALFISWNPPHSPYSLVPEKYKKIYENRNLKMRPNVTDKGIEHAKKHLKNYYAAVSGLDDNFGKLMAFLERENLIENTIVVLTADHGDLMGSHGSLDPKNIWYEEAIGVPFLINWPDQVEPRCDRETLLNTPDIMPTLLSLLDLEIPATVEGRDLSDIFRGEKIQEPESCFICQYAEDGTGYRGVRTSGHTYVLKLQESGVERFLYNNREDPYQMKPKIVDDLSENETALKLEEMLRQYLIEIDDYCLQKIK